MCSYIKEEIEHSVSCHCKAVQFKIKCLKEVNIISCSCSICILEDYKHLIIKKSKFTLSKGKNNLIEYTFNSHKAKHYFCKNCGIKSFYVPRSHPESISINFRCIINNKLVIKKIINFDGRNWEKNIANLKEHKI